MAKPTPLALATLHYRFAASATCVKHNLQIIEPKSAKQPQKPYYSFGFLNFSTIWFTSPIARCLAFSSSVPAKVGGKDQIPDG